MNAPHPLRHSFFQYIGQTSPEPLALEVAASSGIYLYTPEGKRYADLISGIGVSSLGHGNPAVTGAIRDQATRYLHTMVYGEHIQQPQVAYAKLLCENLPEKLNQVFFVNSGSEAVEGAMKLVKRATGRYRIAAFHNAYHGSTHGAQSLMDNEYHSAAYRPFLPGITFLPFDDVKMLQAIDNSYAGVFIETVQGEAGVRIPSREFMTALRNRCDETGTLLVLDEIQTGFGRTGKLFAFEHYGIVPDVLLIAKAMGAGMPIGAFVADRQLMQSLTDKPVLGHITTFGGHPVSAAAGLAGLKYLLENQLIDQVEGKSRLFIDKLQHPAIRQWRSKGLLMAMDLGSQEKVKRLIRHAFEQGVLIDWFLFDDTSVRIAPPLIITEQETDQLCSVLSSGLNELI